MSMRNRNNPFDPDEIKIDHTAVVESRTDILIISRVKDEVTGRALLGQLSDKNYIVFVHNLKTWRITIGSTEALALQGTNKDTLLFSANGHYKGPMTDELQDNLVGMASVCYLATVLPTTNMADDLPDAT